jgi:hypothetical protein
MKKIRALLALVLVLTFAGSVIAADAPAPAAPPESSAATADETTPAPAPPVPAPEPPPAPPAPSVKGLSWFEVSVFAPGLCDYNDAFKARLQATSKLKLRYLLRQCNFIAMVNPDATIRAKAKQIATDVKALIAG